MTAVAADLTGALEEIAGVVGVERALELADRWGGTDKVYIPAVPTQDHPWRAILGDELLARLCAAMGERRIYLPRGCFVELKKRAILELAGSGMSLRQIALQVHATERYVRLVLNEVGAPVRAGDPRQLKLGF